jgi:hypothetical protein
MQIYITQIWALILFLLLQFTSKTPTDAQDLRGFLNLSSAHLHTPGKSKISRNYRKFSVSVHRRNLIGQFLAILPQVFGRYRPLVTAKGKRDKDAVFNVEQSLP